MIMGKTNEANDVLAMDGPVLISVRNGHPVGDSQH